MSLPEKFVERILRDLGEAEGRALCAALDGQPPVSVRLNPAKAGGGGRRSGDEPDSAGRNGGPAECAGVQPENCEMSGAEQPEFGLQYAALELDGPVPWSPGGYYLRQRPQFTLDPDFHAGAYYVQEASSQFVGRLLQGVKMEGARVLDLCAAPGGKTTLYASLVGQDGLVVANEIDRRRAQVLADNVRKWGTANVAVTTCEPRVLGDWEAWFDVVAVDAPCSGEGMFRKDEQAREEWSENNVRLCAARQTEILREAWRALKPGGTLLYSTCTFNRDEDEGSLERMLAWAGDEAAAADEIMMNTARTGGKVAADEIGLDTAQAGEAAAADGTWGVVCGRVGAVQTFRFYPHRTKGEGFFAAVVRKAFDAGGRSRSPKASRTVVSPVDRQTTAELARWVLEPERMHFLLVADTCYGYAEAQYEVVKALSATVPVIYSGVAMGQVFKGKLKPDPALAFYAGLNRDAVPVAELDAEQALRFLRKQDVEAGPLAEGVNLVCVRGRALGFVKRIGARVNNMYPNSLRIIKQ